MKPIGRRLFKPRGRMTCRKRGESLEDYLARTLVTEEDRIQYWIKLTEEMYNRNPKAVSKSIETLRDLNPEVCKIVEDTYAKLQGESN